MGWCVRVRDGSGGGLLVSDAPRDFRRGERKKKVAQQKALAYVSCLRSLPPTPLFPCWKRVLVCGLPLWKSRLLVGTVSKFE